ncbi:MAG: HAD family hydrolase [Silvibacterium sp.]|nr:HAD family hydrolase [Silvibacterium sp.]
MPAHSSLAFANIQYVFLDRDGVINRKLPEGEYVSSWHRFEVLPGAEEAIAKLNRSGRSVIVVTNQRGIALGYYTKADVRGVHEQLQRHLAQSGAHIDAFYFCPHDKNECDCRKPKIGLFEQAMHDFPGASGSNSIIIGDSLSDIEAARNFGAPSIFIEGDSAFQKPGSERARSLADACSPSLFEAVTRFLS